MAEEKRKFDQREYLRKWRAENRDRTRELLRRWRAENPERHQEHLRRYREKHREEIRSRQQARRLAAKEPFDGELAVDGTRRGRQLHGESHFGWKGEEAGYFAKHRLVVRQKGRPKLCEHCGSTDAKQYNWANVDHKYRRNLDDWIRLCASCHYWHDYKNGLRPKAGPKRE